MKVSENRTTPKKVTGRNITLNYSGETTVSWTNKHQIRITSCALVLVNSSIINVKKVSWLTYLTQCKLTSP